MIYIYVHHTVEDYATWRKGFDEHASARKTAGATDEVYIMQTISNPNEITAILGWSDAEKAKAFTQSPELKAAMEKAGVTGPPEIRFLSSAG
jgi:quinol monooxygenase YgiN